MRTPAGFNQQQPRQGLPGHTCSQRSAKLPRRSNSTVVVSSWKVQALSCSMARIPVKIKLQPAFGVLSPLPANKRLLIALHQLETNVKGKRTQRFAEHGKGSALGACSQNFIGLKHDDRKVRTASDQHNAHTHTHTQTHKVTVTIDRFELISKSSCWRQTRFWNQLSH